MSTSAFDKMARIDGIEILTGDQVDDFAIGKGNRVLFFAGDSDRRPESEDLAVILPQIRESFQKRFDIGVYRQDDQERDLMAKYGVVVIPTLVFVRDGKYVGNVPRLQDWSVYLDKVSEILNTPAGDPAGMPQAAE